VSSKRVKAEGQPDTGESNHVIALDKIWPVPFVILSKTGASGNILLILGLRYQSVSTCVSCSELREGGSGRDCWELPCRLRQGDGVAAVIL
jgi:hypothetical protein